MFYVSLRYVYNRVGSMTSECSICNTDFNTEEEGGVQGDIGMLPVSFCPFCLSGVLDMSKQLLGIEEE